MGGSAKVGVRNGEALAPNWTVDGEDLAGNLKLLRGEDDDWVAKQQREMEDSPPTVVIFRQRSKINS